MITARRRLVFNTEKYESVEIEFTISDIPDDTDPDDITMHLDELMAPELHRARLATSRVEGDTSVYTWNRIVGNPEEDAHA